MSRERRMSEQMFFDRRGLTEGLMHLIYDLTENNSIQPYTQRNEEKCERKKIINRKEEKCKNIITWICNPYAHTFTYMLQSIEESEKENQKAMQSTLLSTANTHTKQS